MLGPCNLYMQTLRILMKFVLACQGFYLAQLEFKACVA